MNRKHSRGAVISRLLTLALTMIQGIEAGMMPGGMGGMGGMPGGMGAHMGGLAQGGRQQMREAMGGGGERMPRGGMGGMGANGMDFAHMAMPELKLKDLLDNLEDLEKVSKGEEIEAMKSGMQNGGVSDGEGTQFKITPKMRQMIVRVKNKVLGRVSCQTGCTTNDHLGGCHEQGCVFHYRPADTKAGEKTLCASELTIMALKDEAVGNVKFAVHPYVIEPEDDMVATELFDDIDDKYKYRRKRLESEGGGWTDIVKVCKDISCGEHPPPWPINHGDTLYITVVSVEDDGKTYRHLPSDSFRIVAIGSETGRGCAATLGTRGLRGVAPPGHLPLLSLAEERQTLLDSGWGDTGSKKKSGMMGGGDYSGYDGN